MLLKLAVLTTILFGASLGASLATAEAETSNCTVNDGLQALSCIFKFTEFGAKMDDLDMEDKSQIQEFTETCDTLYNCFSAINCGSAGPESQKAVVSIRNFCDAVIYVANDFAECSDKLEANNSTCFDDWTPFPNGIDEEMDPVKKEELNKMACNNFFGKNSCLEAEIKETCSVQEWYGFRDHFISISNLILNCDFSHLV